MQAQLKENIISLTKERGWSLSKLERDAGLNKNYLSNMLRNESKSPGIEAIAKIAKVLQISIDELLGNESKQAYESKIRDLTVTNKRLFSEVTNYLSSAIINAEQKKELKFDKIIDALYEIYSFSLKDNALHKEFADWYIKSHLQ